MDRLGGSQVWRREKGCLSEDRKDAGLDCGEKVNMANIFKLSVCGVIVSISYQYYWLWRSA
jgi:hypothetical protein